DRQSADGRRPEAMLAADAPDGGPVVTTKVIAGGTTGFTLRAGEPDLAVRSNGHTRDDVVRQTVSDGQDLKRFLLEAGQAAICSNPNCVVAIRSEGIDVCSRQTICAGV